MISSSSRPERSHQKGPPKKPGLSARIVATRLITRVVDDGKNLDALCDRAHGSKDFLDLEIRDQNLARAIAMTVLRNRNLIEAVLRSLMDRPPPKRARLLIHGLHAAIAQILFMDVPDTAAVDLCVTMIGSDERTSRFKSLSNAVLRRCVREKEALLTVDRFKAIDPFPKWFSRRLKSDYGKKRASAISKMIAQRPGLDISVKSDPVGWANRLNGEVLPTGGIRLNTDTPVHDLEGYSDGEWWVQDAAASIPAQLIKADVRSKVLELCAAPGGKTAQLLNAGYEVTALDISKSRLARLEENLDRLQLRAKLINADILEWEADTLYDAVLLDAPCSSTGTIRRHPDVLWSRRNEEISELAELQFKLVMKAFEFLKPGGMLVFSNCSIFKEEGEDLLARVLKLNNGIVHDRLNSTDTFGLSELINGQGALRSLPNEFSDSSGALSTGLDGFFACRLVKPHSDS
ncbi:MAG: transcription antitermination factor NusB [Rhizobiaceae bacterium]|nr:transcription antitermination factor NusB [Rhizobiaceae bacterium]